jgi:hypothetical protein
MSNLLYINSFNTFVDPNNKDKLKLIPGGLNFSLVYKLFAYHITLIDRSNTLVFPIKIKLLPNMKLPEYKVFTETFSDICDKRAIELFNRAVNSNKKLAVMYSGGIDSTLILCSLLKNIDENLIKKHVVVLLSDFSIKENENFFYDYVIKKFNCMSSYRFPYILGNDDYLLISGENADQLFGSVVTDLFNRDNNFDINFKSIESTKNQMIDFMKKRIDRNDIISTFIKPDTNYSEILFSLLEKITKAAPIKIDNVHKFWWWINFITKWQSVYVRVFAYSKNIKNIKMEENYTTFYCTNEFQLWAMNNSDNLIQNKLSKYVSKKYIYDFNKDLDYIKKLKTGSLASIVNNKISVSYIDENMNYSYDYPSKEFYNENNNFIGME